MIKLNPKQREQIQEVALGNFEKVLFPKEGWTMAEQNAYALQSLAASNLLLLDLMIERMEWLP
jgi:uncharacterized protein YozE (UPF0346 family)